MPEAVKTVGRYGILSELGRGGMGVVYLARQTDLDRLVALKEISAFHAADPAVAQRFVRESRLAGSLSHPNVVTVFDFFEHESAPYIAMEYVERGSLRPYVGRLGLAQIGGVLEGVLAGLGAAAERGIVHRDLKPENLMVTADGRVKITDFGIAKATQGTQTSGVLTSTGAAIGTPAYMAPEQAMAGEIGPWTDLYAVGCMAYELCTGKPPFHDAKGGMALLVRHVTDAIPPACEVADVDPGISAWIEQLTAKDPADRPASPAAAWEQLEELLLALLGPRWRRDGRLNALVSAGAPPERPLPDSQAPRTPTTQLEPPAPAPVPVDEGRPWRLLARAGAVALVAAVLIPVITASIDRWNAFAVLSPFEAVGIAVGVWIATRARSPEAAAGALLGFGTLAVVAALGLLRFSLARLDAPAVLVAVVSLCGAAAILAAGIAYLRAAPAEPAPATPVDTGVLLLGLIGAALACAALFVNYDGFSSLWSEVAEGESAEFFAEPVVAAGAILVGLGALGRRQRFASALLLAVGAATALHYLGLLVAAWRAIGEVGEVRAAGLIGLLGGLLAAAAGRLSAR